MNRALPGILLAALALLLIAGVARLMHLRLDKGNAYPSYSTLRSDPLGTRAFYESLERLYPRGVRRNFLQARRVDTPEQTTWFFLGAYRFLDPFRVPETDALLRAILARGGDVVIAVRSGNSVRTPSTRKDDEDHEGDAEGAEADIEMDVPETSAAEPNESDGPSLAAPLLEDVSARWTPREGELESTAARTVHAEEETWPAVYESRSPLGWVYPSGPWKVLYSEGETAMILQRQVGRGRLILLNDTFPFSNEALFHRRQSALLWALTGDQTRFVFNETHLGTVRHQGVIDLIRQYGLQGILAGFVILAGLHIWRAGTPFLPPLPPAARRDDHVLGESSHEGFRHFLAHHLDKGDVVRHCLQEWRRAWGPALRRDDALARQFEQASAELADPELAQAPPVKQYNRLAAILTRKHT